MSDTNQPNHEEFTSQMVPLDASAKKVNTETLPEHLKGAEIRVERLNREYVQDLSTIPHADIILPSGGMVYKKGSVLRKGELKAKFMKGYHEDILTSPSYMRSDTTFEVLLNELILNAGFRAEDLTVFDRASVLMQIFIQNDTNEYKVDEKCTECDHQIDVIDLTNVKDVAFRVPEDSEDPVFPIQVQVDSKTTHTVYLKHATVRDTQEFRKYYKKFGSKNEDKLSTALAAMYIDRVERPNQQPLDSQTPFAMKVAYCEDLPLKALRVIRKEIETLVDEMLPVVQHTCPSCGHTNEIRIPSTDHEFFFQS